MVKLLIDQGTICIPLIDRSLLFPKTVVKDKVFERDTRISHEAICKIMMIFCMPSEQNRVVCELQSLLSRDVSNCCR